MTGVAIDDSFCHVVSVTDQVCLEVGVVVSGHVVKVFLFLPVQLILPPIVELVLGIHHA